MPGTRGPGVGDTHPWHTDPGLLLPQAQAFSHRQVSRIVSAAEVRQHASAMSHQFQQPAPARLVVLVRPQVLCQLLYPAGDDCDLDLGRARVRLVAVLLVDELGLDFLCERHDVCFLLCLGLRRSPSRQLGPPGRTSHGAELYQNSWGILPSAAQWGKIANTRRLMALV